MGKVGGEGKGQWAVSSMRIREELKHINGEEKACGDVW